MTDRNKAEKPALLDVRAVAHQLGVSIRQVWKLHSTRRLPAYTRLSRSVRWKAADIEMFIAADCNMQRFEAAKAREVPR